MTDIVTYCDVNTCEDCQRYGDDCDGDKRVEHTDYISRADAIECCQCHGSLDCINRIKALPSADAVHGEWEDREVFNETDDDHIVEEWQSARCSVCGKYHTTPYMYYFDDFNFCPNCGAIMKGGAE